MTKNIAVLPGDGIGPEIMAVTVDLLEKVTQNDSLRLQIKEAPVGGAAYDLSGTPLPEATLKICDEADAILLGAVGGPKWESLPPEQQPERGALLPLRKHYNLYVNIRPVRIYPEFSDISPLKSHLIDQDVDFVIFRELTGGLYFSQPKQIEREEGWAVDTLKYTRPEIERIARRAFQYAQQRSKKVCSIDKANVLMSSVLWRETVIEIRDREFTDISLQHLYVDNASMQLVLNPKQFDVILTENTFGDILSDEASTIPGSIGLLASASLNDSGFGLYEPCHGSAPDIADQGIANPIAQILSAAMMLRFSLGAETAAQRLENAVSQAIATGVRTKDLCRNGMQAASTKEIATVISRFL